MASWWHRDVLAAGKLPLMLCFLAFVVTFVLTRTITRMIRDGRGPFRNRVTASGVHIHHSVPGIILLIIGAFTAVGGPDSLGWRSFAAVAVGTGTSLVLDEFALILHLQDVYWSGEGQLSVEAVSLTAACLGLSLVGFSPFGVRDVDGIELSLRLTATGILIADGVLAFICVLKGKYRTALFGLFLRPAGDGSEIGGDFYDVFRTGHQTWGIVLGDVCGKGASAAVVTALARYTVRAEALHVSSPAAVLVGLHEALVSYYPDTFCTALFLLLNQVPDGHRLTAATGGHPLPLCRRADGTIETLGRPGSFLGMEETADISEFSAILTPGDIVVLYTDGVTEASNGGSFFGESGIAEVLGACAGLTAQAVADAVVAAALACQDGQARDDIAVVVVKVPPSGER